MTTSTDYTDDHRLVGEVCARYLRAADHRDPARMAALFTDEATVEIYYSGAGADELLAELRGAQVIGEAVASGMVPHPPLGWSHHTTTDHIVTVHGDEATFDAQFVVYSVLGLPKPAHGWPHGAVGAQGSIRPIESGYIQSQLARTSHGWKITRHVIKHDLPYAFPRA